MLNKDELNRDEITQEYAFNVRQTNYYTDAAKYLGLIEKNNTRPPSYNLTKKGKKILQLNFKSRQLAFCECILSHKIFHDILRMSFESGKILPDNKIINMMKEYQLYNIGSTETFKRRAGTIKSWINWIINLVNE